MIRPIDDLDQMIDELNANREPHDAGKDGELADLVELVRGLKELGHTAWPDESFPMRTAIQLSQRLNPPATPNSIDHAAPDLDATGELPPPVLPPRDLPSPLSLSRMRQSGVRKSLEIAAAIVVLVAFTALIATLLGNMNGGSQSSDPTARANSGAAFGAAPAASAAETQTTSPAITDQSSTATATAQTTTPATAFISDPALQALQSAAGFDLRAPAALPPILTLQPPAEPITLGNFTRVALKYQDSTGKAALTITEASPYQDSAETMPADIFNSAVPQDLGYGVTASIYQSDTDIQIWWQIGPTSIRFESGGAPGTTLLSKDLMLSIARSMAPVVHATPSTPSATDVKKDAAIATARELLGTLGGNSNAAPGAAQLTPLATQTALGMPQPGGMDTNAPVWSVDFPNGMSPAGCPEAGVSVCNAGAITVIVDAQSGNVIAWRDASGTWKQP